MLRGSLNKTSFPTLDLDLKLGFNVVYIIYINIIFMLPSNEDHSPNVGQFLHRNQALSLNLLITVMQLEK